jgi:predicted DsbA family dithiol-disulfide isomerase
MTTVKRQKLKIEMIHDIVCSWCPVGYSNIKAAITNLNIDVEFHFLPFELNPNMANEGESIANYFSRQMGWDKTKLIEYQTSLVNTAAKAGVSIDFSKRTHYYHTRHAHLLIHWAKQFNKQTDLNEQLIKAYFKDGLDISNLRVLLDVAESIGLDRQEAMDALTSSQLSQELAQKTTRVKTVNIRSVPAFIINEKTLIAGSNSVEYFEDILSSLFNEIVAA